MAQYNQVATSEVHLKRYFRNKNGETIADIAATDKVDEQAVKNSIRAVELYRARRNVEALNEAVVGTVLDVIPEMKKSIRRQLAATAVVDLPNGKKRKEPDFPTQRGAIAEVRGLIQTVQPKVSPVHATQVNVGTQGNSPRVATGSYIGMEDRLKAITSELESTKDTQQKRLVQAPLQTVEDGEYEEAEPVESEA